MNLDISSLPDSVDELKEVIAYLSKSYSELEDREKSYQQKIEYLEERIRLLQNEIFGRKTEKGVASESAHIQMNLFNEPEAGVPEKEIDEEITIAQHTRKKSGRKRLPEDLPRIEVVHDLSEKEKQCECGCVKDKIGEEVSEKLDIIPATVRVIRHIRYKYACKNCEGVESEGPTVVIAPPALEMIPKGIATSGLLAHILTSKFEDALPFYRQEKIFSRMGVDLTRATMCGWAVKVAEGCEPILDLLAREIRSGPINIDETPVQVLNEPGRSNTSKSYMWVYRGGDPDHPVLIYQYHPTRSGKVPLEFLKGHKGYVQTDSYNGYNALEWTGDIRLIGCWAHVRRKFMDVIKAKSDSKKTGLAEEAVEYIGRLYAIEKYARENNYGPDRIYQLRQKKSKPILEEINIWLNQTVSKTPPKGLLGKAVNYALKNWDRLVRYIEDGNLKPDNNLAENAIRPFVLGRKNWLFAGHPNGATASAAIFSLIETAKANGLKPYFYLRYLFDNLPLAKTKADYKKLLPQYVDPDLITAVS
jgi:transposase